MDTAFSSVFYEISVLVLLAAAIGLVGLLARQPLVVAFIAVGVLAGPDALGLVTSTEFIETLSKISIAVLLFLVGLKLDVTLVRSLGKVAVVAGIGQIAVTVVLGFLLSIALGLDAHTSVFIAIALSFSSTIIIVKLLSDKLEIAALHGKIALGILIVQDIAVVLAMVALAAMGSDAGVGDSGFARLGIIAAGFGGLLAFVVLFIRYAANPLLRIMSESPELMVIFAVGWAAGMAAFADYLGFGKELGGLLAGVALASTQYREAISSRLASLRDFLLLFFFIQLGAGLELGVLGGQVLSALVLSLFILIGKPLIVITLTGYLGYRKRTGFLAGVTLAQISEFSLIFMAMGLSLGFVDDDAVGLVTLVGLITIALSVYMITWSHKLYVVCEPYLGVFERRKAHREQDHGASGQPARGHDFVIFGLGRYGCRIGQKLHAQGFRVLGIDFDPEALTHWRSLGMDADFGDATDPDFVAHLNLTGVRAVVAAVPRERTALTDADPQIALMHGLQAAHFGGQIVLSVHYAADADALRARGATMVLMPFDDAADYAVRRLTEG